MTELTNETIIHFAPLQGFTDTDYRETFFNTIGGIDYYYAPYLSVENNGTIKTARILPNSSKFNHLVKLIPQVLPANLDELSKLILTIDSNHYNEININVGCPYPMVTSKGRGAALIHEPLIVNEFIQYIKMKTSFRVSLKIRAGLETDRELFSFLEQIHFSAVEKIIVHPRTAKQLYKGKANADIFSECLINYPNVKWVYNGDIDCFQKYVELKTRWPDQNEWMIGRGLLANPFLAWQIKNETDLLPSNKSQLLSDFCFNLLNAITNSSNDEGHALNRISLQLFEIFEKCPENRKALKLLKNTRKLSDVRGIIAQLV